MAYNLINHKEIKSQNNSTLYYQLITENNLPSKYIDNDVSDQHPISHIIWHSKDHCIKLSGTIKAASTTNLTIAAPCIEILNVEFKNIWYVQILKDINFNDGMINYQNSLCEVKINSIGNEKNPVYNLNLQANTEISGQNWVIDFYVKGEKFQQTEALFVLGVLDIDASTVIFRNNVHEVGEYYLRCKNILYDTMFDAKRGDLILEYSGGDLDIRKDLRATGTITIYNTEVINNHNQLVSDNLQVSGESFNNFGVVTINNKSQFDLINDFYNAQLGYIKTTKFCVSSTQAANNKIQIFKNEGKIECYKGEIHAVEMQAVAQKFTKTNSVLASSPSDRCHKGKWYYYCSLYQDVIKTLPIPSTVSARDNLYLNINTFKTVSSILLSVTGRISFNSSKIIYEDFKLFQWGTCKYYGKNDDFFDHARINALQHLVKYEEVQYHRHGSYTYSAVTNPAVKQSYTSKLFAKQGIEGAVNEILDSEVTWAYDEPIIKSLISYNPENIQKFTDIIFIQRKIYFAHKANMLNRLKNYDEAISFADMALEIDPEYRYAKQCKALSFNNKGIMIVKNYEQALEFFNKAIDLDKNNMQYRYNKVYLLAMWKSYDEALKELDNIVTLAPKDVNARYAKAEILALKGVISLSEGSAEDSLEYLQQAIAINGLHPDYHARKGVALNELKRYEEAIDAANRALNLYSDSTRRIDGGQNILNNNNTALIIAFHTKELVYMGSNLIKNITDPRSVKIKALEAQGSNQYEEGNYDEALEYYNKIIKVNNKISQYHISKSKVLTQLKRYDEAIQSANVALDLDPNSKNAEKAYLEAMEAKTKLELKFQSSFESNQCLKIFEDNGIGLHTIETTHLDNVENCNEDECNSVSWKIQMISSICNDGRVYLETCIKEFEHKGFEFTPSLEYIRNMLDTDIHYTKFDSTTFTTFDSMECFKNFEKENIDICFMNSSKKVVSTEKLNECNNCISASSWEIEKSGCLTQEATLGICLEEFKQNDYVECIS